MTNKARINHQIQAREVRVIGPAGENFGVLTLGEALKAAQELNSDLIEISPNATPPVAKIMDYGKFQYLENKKLKAAKAKSRTAEVKTVQVKIGTGEHDLLLKAKRAGDWLEAGNRVQVDLFLRGRAKYLDEKFLRGRIERILRLIPVEFSVAEPAKRSPKGFTVLLERGKK